MSVIFGKRIAIVETGRTGRPIARSGDTRVVDQDIQPSLLRLDIGCRARYCVPLGQIDLYIAGGEAFAPEFCHGSLASTPIACADENLMPFSRQAVARSHSRCPCSPQ